MAGVLKNFTVKDREGRTNFPMVTSTGLSKPHYPDEMRARSKKDAVRKLRKRYPAPEYTLDVSEASWYEDEELEYDPPIAPTRPDGTPWFLEEITESQEYEMCLLKGMKRVWKPGWDGITMYDPRTGEYVYLDN